MNLFITSQDPEIAAYEHCTVHARKMPTEVGQMLSTSKRMLDGVYTEISDPNGKIIKEWLLPGEVLTYNTIPVYDDDGVFIRNRYKKHIDNQTAWYFSTHYNHPCSKWLRESSANWDWAVAHLRALCEVYTADSGKVHLAWEKLSHVVVKKPRNIRRSIILSEFAMAMPEHYKTQSVTKSYQKYLTNKLKEWSTRSKPLAVEWAIETPTWFK